MSVGTKRQQQQQQLQPVALLQRQVYPSSTATTTSMVVLQASRSDDNDNDDSNDDDDVTAAAAAVDSGSGSESTDSDNWLETWALQGAQKIASLDIAERTQRALLAEMCEDEIYQLTIELESLVDETTNTITNLDRAKEIASQSRSLQQQYKELVSGEPSAVLSTLTKLKNNNDQ